MAGQLIGYVRVSTADQNINRQLEGITLDKKYIDKVSGKDMERPALNELIDYAREGDTIILHSLDRLGRNLHDLSTLVFMFTKKNIKVQFVKENLIFSGEDTPMSKLLFSMLGAFSEFERALIKERQKEGIVLAKNRGAYKGRKQVLNAEQVEAIKSRVAQGHKKNHIARDFNVHRGTLYQYLKVSAVADMGATK